MRKRITCLEFVADSVPGTACYGSGILLDSGQRETMWFIRETDEVIAELDNPVDVGIRATLLAHAGIVVGVVCVRLGEEHPDYVYATWLSPYGTGRQTLERLQRQLRVLVNVVGDDGSVAMTLESDSPLRGFAARLLERAGTRIVTDEEEESVRDYYRAKFGDPVAWRLWQSAGGVFPVL